MVAKTVGFVLVCLLAWAAAAADRTEKEKAGGPKAIEVSDLLKQAAASPLGPGEARWLRAIAELVEKEALPPALQSPSEQRKRLALRLSNAPVADVAKAVEESLVARGDGRLAPESSRNAERVVVVAEPVTNTLLISGPRKKVNSLKDLVAKLDTRPDMVMAQVYIANYLVRRDARPEDTATQKSADDEAPSMDKDGAAWLEWAGKQGRLEVLSRPQVMTLVNQPAIIQIGSAVPRIAPAPSTDSRAVLSTGHQTGFNSSQPLRAGLTVGLTPNISPEGLIVMELDVEIASIVNRDAAGTPIIAKTSVQTTVSAKDGQTVVFGGVTQHGEGADRRLIIAVTPRVNRAR